MHNRSRILLLLCAALAAPLAPGLAQSGPAPTSGAPAPAAAAVADPARPPEDRARDASRKPAECIAFAGVRVGDKVVEFLPGGGYYTRILSAAVGPTGRVVAVVQPKSPTAPAEAPEPAARVRAFAGDPHYANVEVRVQPMARLELPQAMDVAWTSLNYHDLHNIEGLDIATFNRSVFASLRPGGVFLVIDHAAEPGSGARDTRTLHRIDADQVRKEVLAAGFELAGGSDALHNAADHHTAKVFDADVRGATDQFILKFRRPGGRASD
jgi:predicted methyltransferase